MRCWSCLSSCLYSSLLQNISGLCSHSSFLQFSYSHFFFFFQVFDVGMGVTILQSSTWMEEEGLGILMRMVLEGLAGVVLVDEVKDSLWY